MSAPVAPATTAHAVTDPAILYLGTPVVLVASVNPDGGPNLALVSSAFWLGDRCVLGISRTSRTWANARRRRELTLCLPSAAQVDAVDRLALLTGADPVPGYKVTRGCRHEPDKFGAAGLTPVPSDLVAAPRAAECPLAIEVEVVSMREAPVDDRKAAPVVEGRVLRVHAHPEVLVPGRPNRIDPDRWRPLIMSFQQFYGLAGRPLQPSRLATIDEDAYRV